MLRKAKRLTLEELGRAASIGYKHIADVERGEKTASFDAIDKLAKALRVPPHELFLPVYQDDAEVDQSRKQLVKEIAGHSSPAVRRFVVDVLSLVRRLEAELAAESR